MIEPRSQSFVHLVDEHGRLLRQVARSYARTAVDRSDLEAEMVAQLWKAFPRYDPARRFSTWMYRVALNVAISFARGRREEVPLEQAGSALALEPSTEADRTAELRRLEAFVAQLEPMNKALVLLYLDDHPQREIAEVLGISESNVSTRLHRLKQRLREQMVQTQEEALGGAR
ncbi:MAG: sigma-70 family RNA polymerase sigma factor [Myxococcaceae bacterium]